MIIYPAIDLRNGNCVRLTKGDYEQQTIYENEPSAMVGSFIQQGAEWIHVVDLDAAKNPGDRQIDTLRKICKTTAVKIQVGGGVRCEQDVIDLLELGTDRVVIGSLAVKNPALFSALLAEYGSERIILAADVRINNGEAKIAVNGWQEATDTALEALLTNFQQAGLRYVLCTDIEKDGCLQGPNFDLYKTVRARFPQLNILASGGVRNKNDVSQLREQNIDGVIIGKAIYENKLSLGDFL